MTTTKDQDRADALALLRTIGEDIHKTRGCPRCEVAKWAPCYTYFRSALSVVGVEAAYDALREGWYDAECAEEIQD